MIAKRIANFIAPEDAKLQCTADPRCHRKNGHEGACQTMARVLAEKLLAMVKP